MANMGGFGDMSAIEKMLYGDVDGDADLEAELMALEAEEERERRPAPPPVPVRAPVQAQRQRGPREDPIDFQQIGRLARQVSKEAVITDDEDDPSVENEPDLLNELNDILGEDTPASSQAPRAQAPPPRTSPPPRQPAPPGRNQGFTGLLQERIKMYKLAISNANKEGDSSKSRRLGRGLKTLETQLKSAKAGRAVNEEDIPPPCGTGDHKRPPPPPSPTPDYPQPTPQTPPTPPSKAPASHREELIADSEPQLSVDGSTMKMLERRGNAYKLEAVKARDSGDRGGAVRNMKVAMQFDQVIDAIKAGEPVDLSLVPPSPTSAVPATATPAAAPPPLNAPPKSKAKPSLEPPKTLLEGLQQRLQIYIETGAKAQEENNERKARMMVRIQKQYKSAISAVKAGRAVNVEELPVPPGCPPMPGERSPAGSESPPPIPAKPPMEQAKAISPGDKRQSDGVQGRIQAGPSPAKLSKHEEQLQFLITRQLQFKRAALVSKKRGDVAGAKKYLVQAKGFDQMIEAARAGLPVDITKTPAPPQPRMAGPALQPQVSVNDSAKDEGGWSVVQGGRDEVFATLEKDLIHQIQLSQQNQEYFTRLGDVARVNRFEQSANVARKDLLNLRQAFKLGDPAPRFRYETRTFPSLRCNPDLGEDDMELGVIRGLQVKLPSGYKEDDADLFVRYEFPFPQDQPQTGKTGQVKGSSSPAWNERCKLAVNRKSRQLMRLLKRQGIKFEVYQKGGFLRSDKLIGICEAKLAPLEHKAEIHQSFDLMEGRKQIGGKLEIRIRIREPFVSKVPEMVKEKWLVIDEFAPSRSKPKPARGKAEAGRPQEQRPQPVSSGNVVRVPVQGLPKVQMSRWWNSGMEDVEMRNGDAKSSPPAGQSFPSPDIETPSSVSHPLAYSLAARKKLHATLLNRKTRNWYQCRRCRYHGQFVFLAGGHYQVCPFKNCTCQACRYVSKDTERAGQRMREWRRHKKGGRTERQPSAKPHQPRIPAPGHPSVASPTPSEIAEAAKEAAELESAVRVSQPNLPLMDGQNNSSQNQIALPTIPASTALQFLQNPHPGGASSLNFAGLPLGLLSPGSVSRSFIPMMTSQHPIFTPSPINMERHFFQNLFEAPHSSAPSTMRPGVLQHTQSESRRDSLNQPPPPLHLPTVVRPHAEDTVPSTPTHDTSLQPLSRLESLINATSSQLQFKQDSPLSPDNNEAQGQTEGTNGENGVGHSEDEINMLGSPLGGLSSLSKGLLSGPGFHPQHRGVISNGGEHSAMSPFALTSTECRSQLMNLSQQVGSCSFTLRPNGEILFQSETEGRGLRLVDMGTCIKVTIEGQNGKRSNSEWPKVGGWDSFLMFVHTLLVTLCQICSAVGL